MSQFLNILNEGIVYHHQGQLEKAQHCYLQIEPQSQYYAEALHLLGVIDYQKGAFDKAVIKIEKALTLLPNNPHFHDNLGISYKALKNYSQAIYHLKAAIKIDYKFSNSLFHLGNLYMELCQWSEAIKYYRMCIDQNPNNSTSYNNLCSAYLQVGRPKLALKCIQKAYAINSENPEINFNMGNVFHKLGDYEQAIFYYKKTLELKPDYFEAMNNLGNAYRTTGEISKTIGLLKRAIELNPDYQIGHSNLLFYMHSLDQITLRDLQKEHQNWGQQIESKITPFSDYSNSRDPKRKIKLGYLAPDFRNHSTAFFARSFFENINHNDFQIICFASQQQTDEYSAFFKDSSSKWFNIFNKSDQATAQLIKDEEIDILIDPGVGHAGNNRLPVFAYKPAPVQITQYPYSTGLTRIDYRFSDASLNPPPINRYKSSETIINIPSFTCYSPPLKYPDVSNLPLLKNGYPTFGSLNHISKISPTIIKIWAEILKKLPQAKLILKALAFSYDTYKHSYLKQFESEGIPQEQLILLPYSASRYQHLEIYHQIDIALDTFPYSGHITSCEALLMGVPVITLQGELPFSRLSSSVLKNSGLEQLITTEVDEYVETTLKLAGNRDKLIEFRTELRQLFQQSLICNQSSFKHSIESIYRNLWNKWCDANRQEGIL